MTTEHASPRYLHPQSPAYRRRRRRRIVASAFILLVLSTVGYFILTYHGPMPPTEIYRGITYSCQRLREGPESGGLLHLIRADLNVPDVSIYITPLDPQAQEHGQEYRLKYVTTALRENHLAAAVNGSFFSSDSSFIRMPGDWARSTETVVANHIVNHIDPNSYLIWWDDDGATHYQLTKPPAPENLANAKCAISVQANWLHDFKIEPGYGGAADRRTVIAADPAKRLVWLAVFDRATYHFVAQTMADMGIPNATTLDGGTSSTMAIGDQSRGVRPGAVTWNWRPVAVQIGFRADPLPPK